MVIASGIDDENLRTKIVQERTIAGFIISMMIGLGHIHLSADFRHRSLDVSFIGSIALPVSTAEVASIVISEISISNSDCA
jgi:hypothetical protein